MRKTIGGGKTGVRLEKVAERVRRRPAAGGAPAGRLKGNGGETKVLERERAKERGERESGSWIT